MEQDYQCSEMVEIAKRCVNNLGFTKFRLSKTTKKTIIMFGITNQGISTEEQWKTFPVLIEVFSGNFVVKVVFSYNNNPYKFSEGGQLQKAVEFVTRSNYGLQVGFFNFRGSSELMFESSVYYRGLDSSSKEKALNFSISIALGTYKKYAYGVVRIIESQNPQSIDTKLLATQCEHRDKEMSKNSRKPPLEIEPQKFDFETELKLVQEMLEHWELARLFDLSNLKIDYTSKTLVYTGSCQANLHSIISMQEVPYQSITSIEQKIILVYKLGYEFTEFPSQHVSLDPSTFEVRFVPKDLTLVLKQSNSSSLSKYCIKMRSELNDIIKNCVASKNQDIYTISLQDKIPIRAFDFPQINSSSLNIGHGGFGYVYKNQLYGVEVAIKIPKEKLLDKAKAKLAKELNISKFLQHQNCVKSLGVVEFQKGKFGLVQEYCANKALNEYLKHHSLSLAEKVRLLKEAAQGLEFMHAKRIFHFDVKPHNMFLTKDLQLKIADFGLSEVGTFSKPGFTLMFCSPEQIVGDNPGEKSDVWSFGMTMYSILFMNSPYHYLVKQGEKLNKRSFYLELTKNQRKPNIEKDFELKYPKLVKLMKDCWATQPALRTEMKKVRKQLERIYLEICNSA